MPAISTAQIIVELTGIDPDVAFSWGFEAGAFAQMDNDELLGQHAIFAGNAIIIEMIALERGFVLDVLDSDADKLLVMIGRRHPGKWHPRGPLP